MTTADGNQIFGTNDLTRAVAHWRTVSDELECDQLVLQQKLDDARRKVEACEFAIRVCQELDRVLKPDYGIHSHIDPRELTHCETQMVAAMEIARRTGGRLKLADAARLIYAAGLSDAAKPSGVKSSLATPLNTRDEWESEGKGTGFYRLLTYKADDVGEGGEEWPEQSSPTGDGDVSPHTYRANGATEVAVGRIIA